MIRLLKFLITGDWHIHKWRDAGDEIASYENSNSKRPYKRRQPMQCEVCGARKSFKL